MSSICVSDMTYVSVACIVADNEGDIVADMRNC